MSRLSILVACFAAAPLWAQQDVEQLEQQSLYDAASEASAYVVRIETFGGLEKVGQVLVNMGPTSGVVVHADGFIVSSAFNFIQDPSSILVQLPSGKRKAARIVSRDNSRRLVLLKVEVDEPLDVPSPALKSDVHVGQWAVTVGRTLPGSAFNMSVGIISATNRIWSTAVQTDANVSPANYGGALVDIHGRIIGVLVPLSPESSKVVAGAEWYDSGIGFAIPLEDIIANLDRLKEADVHAGKLGVSLRGADAYGDELIVGVCWPKSPAREAGIKTGDKIVSINGISLARHVEMKHVLGPLLAGETIRVQFDRGGKIMSREVELADKLLAYEHAFLGVLPARIAEQPEESAGVRVRYVYEDSPAAAAGLKKDDRILAIDDEPIANAAALRSSLAALEPGAEVKIHFASGDDEPTASVELASMPTSVPAELPAQYPELDEFNEDLPPLGRIDIRLPEEVGECLAYIPEDYDPRFEHSLLVLLPVPGQKVDAVLKEWKATCDASHTVLLMPQAKDARAWLPTETAFIRKTIENLRKEYVVDPERVAVYGANSSGAMAFLTAFTHRDLMRGVAAFNSPVPSRAPAVINEPLQRLAAYVIGPKTGRVATRIEANVKQLRKSKIPVTQKQVEGSELDNDLRNELLRWIDTLDRI